MRTRVVVLGAGFGGLELTTSLSDAFGDALEIVLIDKADAFVRLRLLKTRRDVRKAGGGRGSSSLP
jgi:NADH dehydrogenase FAD-containing subunit